MYLKYVSNKTAFRQEMQEYSPRGDALRQHHASVHRTCTRSRNESGSYLEQQRKRKVKEKSDTVVAFSVKKKKASVNFVGIIE
jgi:hypothetical protein